MTYKEWVEAVPSAIRDDPVWRVEAYRLALFAGDLAWHDASKLLRDKQTVSIADHIPNERGYKIGEEEPPYSADLSHLLDNPPMSDAEQPHAPRTTHHALES